MKKNRFDREIDNRLENDKWDDQVASKVIVQYERSQKNIYRNFSIAILICTTTVLSTLVYYNQGQSPEQRLSNNSLSVKVNATQLLEAGYSNEIDDSDVNELIFLEKEEI